MTYLQITIETLFMIAMALGVFFSIMVVVIGMGEEDTRSTTCLRCLDHFNLNPWESDRDTLLCGVCTEDQHREMSA